MGKIVWLASFPKSGNTWVRAFLHNLLTDAERPYDINELDTFAVSDSQAQWYQRFDPRPPTALSLEEIAALRPRVHHLFTQLGQGPIFVKTHMAAAELGGTPLITVSETVAAIYIVRNPLDVVVSHSHHYGNDLDRTIELLAADDTITRASETHVPEYHSSWSAHVASWTSVPSPGLLVVRYEDLLLTPNRSFAAIARFLRLDVARGRLERAIRHCSFRVLQEQEKRHGFRERTETSERFFRAGKAGQWRSALSPAQIERVVARHGAQMDRFGYRPK
ncbi:MAG: sulfotransferase domain-containing protein [Dongiaceae bacterium]